MIDMQKCILDLSIVDLNTKKAKREIGGDN
jgi:hypothetical protein